MRYWRDWSSDVCSSDLARPDLVARLLGGEAEDLLAHACGLGTSKPSLRTAGAASRISSRGQLGRGSSGLSEIGRASCRERGQISVVAVSLKKKTIPTDS